MAHDLVIRGGLVVDGTGAPARPGDLAVANGRIAEVGVVTARGEREIDAAGLAVAPGFVDPHTHYDAQLTWDPLASCSSWHGVTTVVTGNCGFTIAPCRPGDRDVMMRMLQYVEGMSLEAMRKGIRWDFESFGEYLDALERGGLWVNVGALVGHSAIRQYVMGDAGWERAASDDEIERMATVVREAMSAGIDVIRRTASSSDRARRSRTQWPRSRLVWPASQKRLRWAPASERPRSACGWEKISRTAAASVLTTATVNRVRRSSSSARSKNASTTSFPVARATAATVWPTKGAKAGEWTAWTRSGDASPVKSAERPTVARNSSRNPDSRKSGRQPLIGVSITRRHTGKR